MNTDNKDTVNQLNFVAVNQIYTTWSILAVFKDIANQVFKGFMTQKSAIFILPTNKTNIFIH